MTAVLAAAALTVVSGCAARKSSLGGRFVKPGEPATSFDVQPAKPKADGALATMPAGCGRCRPTHERTLTLGCRRSNRKTLASRSAILRLAMDPSAANHHRSRDAYRQAGVTDYAYRH